METQVNATYVTGDVVIDKLFQPMQGRNKEKTTLQDIFVK